MLSDYCLCKHVSTNAHLQNEGTHPITLCLHVKWVRVPGGSREADRGREGEK